MPGIKIRTQSPNASDAIQRELFRLGYSWPHVGKSIRYVSSGAIFADDSNMEIYRDFSEMHFLESDFEEISLDELSNRKTINKMPRNIDINGVKVKSGDWIRDGGTDRVDVRMGIAGEVVFSHDDILLVNMLTKSAIEIWGTKVVVFPARDVLVVDEAEKVLIRKLM
jgi:hypothetical protein